MLTTGVIATAATIAYGHTSESLATTETETSKAPRFLPLGTQSFPNAMPVGAQPKNIVFPLTAPVVVNPGEYFAVTARFPAGVGLMNISSFNIGIDSYWE